MKQKSSKKGKSKSENKYKNRQVMLKWRQMRDAEYVRRKKNRAYSAYKNRWLMNLVKDATGKEYWTTEEERRLKILRKRLEKDYNVPINFFCAFVYYATYKYMNWNNRNPKFRNYVGFISSEWCLTDFANYLSTRTMSWRIKNSLWPPDFLKKWGKKLSVKGQKLGNKDKIVKHDIMSDYVMRKINRHL